MRAKDRQTRTASLSLFQSRSHYSEHGSNQKETEPAVLTSQLPRLHEFACSPEQANVQPQSPTLGSHCSSEAAVSRPVWQSEPGPPQTQNAHWGCVPGKKGSHIWWYAANMK